MLSKLDALAVFVILKVKGYFTDFKKDEGGMEIVQVVLLILIGVLAIVAIWGVLDGWLADLWGRIAGKEVAESTIG